MLWPEFIKRASKNDEINLENFLGQWIGLKNQQNITAIPENFILILKTYGFSVKTSQQNWKTPYKTLKHPRFRAAYDFLLIREKASKCKPDLGKLVDKISKK
ncbi:MAG: hypothetical protein Ct9H90mP22_0050 [Gammaproteobacteria bacterium]|nr:MAG: hypothetical protein Ct9H90mP22_0050 [Gammaproteobacteria bacterium]